MKYIVLALLYIYVNAAIITIPPGSVHRVRDAAYYANSGDIIQLEAGVYVNCTDALGISLNKNVTVRGVGT